MAKKQYTNENDFGALWKQKSKTGLTYFTGKTVDGQKIVAFITTSKKNEKEPDIRIYKSKDKEDSQDLPF